MAISKGGRPMPEQCAYCELDTAGQHQAGCPARIPLGDASPTPKGWECPKCGRVMAPWVSTCFSCPAKTVEVKSAGAQPGEEFRK